MDPLSILRDFTIRGSLDTISRVGDEIRFAGSYSFPASASTAYRSKQGNFYTLDSLLFFVTNHHLKHTDYIQAARRHGIAPVTLPDRRPLLDYLQGRTSTSDAIQFISTTNISSVPAVDSAKEAAGAAVVIDINSDPDVRVLNEEEDAVVDYVALIEANERPFRDREGILVCRNRDFYGIVVKAMEREEKRQKMEAHQRKDGLVAKSKLMGAEERGYGDELGLGGGAKGKVGVMKGGKIGEGVPIILVPSAAQTLITMYNVKEFLEDGMYVPSEVKMKQMSGPKPECVTVLKFSNSKDKDRRLAYEVRDKPSTLKKEDWDRVVAAIVLGKEWQFKDWPFKDHVEIFNKIIGFYLRFEDDSLESVKNVKQWNVKIISISKNKRHQDKAAVMELWDKLEQFTRSRSYS
ncbi:CDC73-like protein [Drosera capensis]